VDPKIVGQLAAPYSPKVVGQLAEPPDLATLPDAQIPEQLRSESDRMRNAHFYVQNLGLSVDEAWEYEPQINEVLYGAGTSSAAAWKLTRERTLGVRRKSIPQAIQDAFTNVNLLGEKVIGGLGRQLAEVKGVQSSLIDPAFRWMFGLPKDVDLDQFLVDISKAASDDLQESRQAHPELGYAIDRNAGYGEALRQVITRPENWVQGVIENVPILLEGVLGTMAGGPAGGIAVMAAPISATVYQDARAAGTDVLPAFAQAVATAGIEAAIEQWTLGRKIGLGRNIAKILEGGRGRAIVWEGTKAFFRGSAEEGSQQFNQNFWQWVLTDRSQKWFEGVQQATALGGPLELLMSGAFASAGKIGAPVSPQEARRRLDILRRGVEQADLSATQKQEILGEIDRAAELVPEIIIGRKEGSGEGTTAEAAATAAAGTGAVPGEGSAPVAGGAPAAAPRTPAELETEALWQRLTGTEPFTARNDAEAELKEAYDAGILEKPEHVAEWMGPGSTADTTAQTVAPSGLPTRARIEDLLTYVSPDGRDQINSRERADLKQAFDTPRAHAVFVNPQLALDKIATDKEINREEFAGLWTYVADVRARRESVRQLWQQATDPVTRDGLAQEEERLTGLIDSVAVPMAASSSEWGRHGRTLQMMLNEKLEPEYVKAQAARKKKAALTEQEAAALEDMTARLNEKAARLAELEKQQEARAAEAVVKERPRRRKDDSPEAREQRIETNKAKLKALLEAGC